MIIIGSVLVEVSYKLLEDLATDEHFRPGVIQKASAGGGRFGSHSQWHQGTASLFFNPEGLSRNTASHAGRSPAPAARCHARLISEPPESSPVIHARASNEPASRTILFATWNPRVCWSPSRRDDRLRSASVQPPFPSAPLAGHRWRGIHRLACRAAFALARPNACVCSIISPPAIAAISRRRRDKSRGLRIHGRRCRRRGDLPSRRPVASIASSIWRRSAACRCRSRIRNSAMPATSPAR